MVLDRLGPLPRLRIYTSLAQYATVANDLVAGRVAKGDQLAELVRRLTAELGIARAVPMPMARVGIWAALKSLIKPGQRVILSPYTIADVVNMVLCAGGVPVFADIERQTCNIDAAEVERLIDANTGAVLVTHFYGLMCDVERIAAVCRARGVPLVEDAAQAFGARLRGRPAGTFGDAGVYSFGMYKNVNCFFGGMVVTGRADLAERIEALMAPLPYQPLGNYLKKVLSGAITDVLTFPAVFRALTFWLFRFAFLHGVDAVNNRLKIDVDPAARSAMPPEYLCRMTPLQARLIVSQLDRVDRDTAARVRAARIWHDGLKDLPDLILPPIRDDGSHMYWYFPIQYRDRHALVAHALRHFRDITESYHRNCAALPCFAPYARDCPNAQATADSLIYLPTYPRYAHSEIEKTVKVIRSFFGK